MRDYNLNFVRKPTPVWAPWSTILSHTSFGSGSRFGPRFGSRTGFRQRLSHRLTHYLGLKLSRRPSSGATLPIWPLVVGFVFDILLF